MLWDQIGMDTSEAHPEEPGESSAETTSHFFPASLFTGNCPLSTMEKPILSFMSTALF